MYVHGAWNMICDRCGGKFKNIELRKTWDGLYVCPMDYDERNQQDFVTATPDNQRIPYARPEPTRVYQGDYVQFDGESVQFDDDDVSWQGES